jgi:zinc transport system substrate-binding protein
MQTKSTRRGPAFVGLLIALILTSAILGYAVSQFTAVPGTAAGGGRPTLKVLATIFPLADWAREVGGDRANVSLLVPSSSDVYSFEPSAGTIHAISSADLLILNGAGLEPWAKAAIASADNPHLVVVNCSEGISLIKSVAFPLNVSQAVDPHIWLDPTDAVKMVHNIMQGFVKADPTDSAYYNLNSLLYQSKLQVLNLQFLNLTNSLLPTRDFISLNTSFGYLASRYNLVQLPAFGPSAPTPTPQDVNTVVGLINQNRLCYVGYERWQNTTVPTIITSQTHASLVPLDSLEALTQEQQAEGQTYLTLMNQNLLFLTLSLTHAGC